MVQVPKRIIYKIFTLRNVCLFSFKYEVLLTCYMMIIMFFNLHLKCFLSLEEKIQTESMNKPLQELGVKGMIFVLL